MEKRKFGKTDLMVTKLCFGTWEIGGYPFYNRQKEKNSLSLLKEAFDLGINFFDTAPVYGFGHAEKVLGKAFKGIRDSIVISTKCDLRWKNESLDAIYTDARRESIMEEIDLSLKRLQTDYIDLYLLHWPDKDSGAPIGESIETLEKIKAKGKIRHYGVSNFNIGQIKETGRYGSVDALQNHYSLLRTDADKNLLPYLVGNAIGFQAYSPLERGILTDKTINELREKDEVAVNWILESAGGRKNQKINEMKKISKKYEVPFASFVIACTVARFGVTTAIAGTQKSEHLKQAVDGANMSVSREDLDAMEKIVSLS